MSQAERTELFSRLKELSDALPEMRFGQLIANLAVVACGTDPGAVWDMEDADLFAAANWQLAELSSRRAADVA